MLSTKFIIPSGTSTDVLVAKLCDVLKFSMGRMPYEYIRAYVPESFRTKAAEQLCPNRPPILNLVPYGALGRLNLDNITRILRSIGSY